MGLAVEPPTHGCVRGGPQDGIAHTAAQALGVVRLRVAGGVCVCVCVCVCEVKTEIVHLIPYVTPGLRSLPTHLAVDVNALGSVDGLGARRAVRRWNGHPLLAVMKVCVCV